MHWTWLAPDPAETYVGDNLRSGLALSADVLATRPLSEYKFYAATAGDPSGLRLSEFRTGRARPTAVGDRLAADLCSRFPSSQLVVEMPLAQPTDPFVAADENDGLVVWKGGVYAACRIAAGQDRVRSVLLQHDSSFLYNTFIIDDVRPFPAMTDGNPGMRTKAILIGAYDGEGLVGAFHTGIE